MLRSEIPTKGRTMKKLLAAASLAALMGASAAQADTNYMIGVTWGLGGGSNDLGFSARMMFSEAGSNVGFGGGVTYYMGSGDVGFDAIAAWMQNDIVVGGGYDFAAYSPVFTLGVYQ